MSDETANTMCRVHAFPLAARRRLVRYAARHFESLQPSPALAYLRLTKADLAARLAAVGVPAEEVQTQLELFQNAVRAELFRLAFETGRIQGEGDAA